MGCQTPRLYFMNIVNCQVFRCSRKDEMYLYVHSDKKVDELPEKLIKLVGQLAYVMDLELTEERKLARVDVVEVMKSLNDEDKGYFIQMPPSELISNLYFGD